jgi:hypothetical protein
MSSLIFGSIGSIDIFGGETSPSTGKMEEKLKNPRFRAFLWAVSEGNGPPPSVPVLDLATDILSLLFSAGFREDKVVLATSPTQVQIGVIGRTLETIPSSVLRFISRQHHGISRITAEVQYPSFLDGPMLALSVFPE